MSRHTPFIVAIILLANFLVGAAYIAQRDVREDMYCRAATAAWRSVPGGAALDDAALALFNLKQRICNR